MVQKDAYKATNNLLENSIKIHQNNNYLKINE